MNYFFQKLLPGAHCINSSSNLFKLEPVSGDVIQLVSQKQGSGLASSDKYLAVKMNSTVSGALFLTYKDDRQNRFRIIRKKT